MNRSTNVFSILISTLMIIASSPQISRAEEWKGELIDPTFEIGALYGLQGVYNSAKSTLRGILGYRIVDRGFVPEINDQVFLEGSSGPVFGLLSGEHIVDNTLGIRWSFRRNESVAYFALGGVAITHNSLAYQSSRGVWEIGSYMGIGAMITLTRNVFVRVEGTYRFLGAGINFGF